MPTNYAPITLEHQSIDKDTFLYLVAVEVHHENPQLNTYSLKGSSVSLDQLPSDPFTHANHYWPMSAEALLQAYETHKDLLFPLDNKLTDAPLSYQQVKDAFGINLHELKPRDFNFAIGQQIRNE